MVLPHISWVELWRVQKYSTERTRDSELSDQGKNRGAQQHGFGTVCEMKMKEN